MFSPIKSPKRNEKKHQTFLPGRPLEGPAPSLPLGFLLKWNTSQPGADPQLDATETAENTKRAHAVPARNCPIFEASFRFLGESACEILRSARVRCSTRPAPRSVLGIKQNINAIFRCSIYKPLCMLRELFDSSSVDFV